MALLEKLTDEELKFCECLHNPISAGECIFSDFDNLGIMGDEEDDLAHYRNSQLAMVSFEYMIDYDDNLSQKENFNLLQGAGDIYNIGSRKYGKTLITLIVDILLSIIHLDGWETIFTSYDAVHIRSVLERIIPITENHPFYQLYDVHVKRSPTYLLRFKNGFVIHSVNMNVLSTNPGNQFFGHHVRKLWGEECSFETAKVHEKRVDAVSELGCIERLSGMTNFTKHSPAGKIFYDLKKKPWIVNLPQYVNPLWDAKEKKDAIEKYGGESSVGYRVFVKGEVVEEGISAMDMERVRKCYKEKRTIKNFEIGKDSYPFFKNKIIVERPKNATNVYMASDIGESAPSEIVIIFEINEKYVYAYNITLHNLTDKEQYLIMKWLGEELSANFIGLDTTNGTGRAIFRRLGEVFPKENLVWVSFNEKLPVDFEKDDKGNVIFKGGHPVHKEEYVSEWSVKRLQHLLYNTKMEIPLDYKFDTQLNSLMCMISGTRTIYKCVAEEDHLYQAFQVLSIMIWYNEFNSINPIMTKKFSKFGV